MNHQKHIRKCFQLAKKGRGQVSPNPLVGCVITKNNKILSTGYHHYFGGDHAEIDALKKINFKARGATLYCNLEPCFHEGKTPACVQTILKSGIKQVVISNLDPNPLVAGKSVKLLRKKGISVEIDFLREEGEILNRFFFHWIEKKTPYVILKLAASLDGKISESNQKQTWLTGDESVQNVHRLRSEVGAILIGHKTLKVDQPQLNVRKVASKFQPQRIILDSKLSTTIDHPIFKTNGGKIFMVIDPKKVSSKKINLFESKGIEVIPVLSLKLLLKKIGKQGLSSILVEGGGEVFSSFLEEKLVHEIRWFAAPKVLGSKAYDALPNLNRSFNQDFNLENIKKYGNDICFQFMRKK